jgi:phosphoribosylformylglycinamidine synthase subunit PurL
MGQFRDTIAGMAEACQALGVPITGGNVSFYNATGDVAVHPTPVIGVLGVLEEVVAAVGNAFVAPGDAIFLVGAPTRPGLGGSEWLWRVHGRVAGRPPRIDLGEEAALHRLLVAAADLEWLRSAHDVATGGLVTTLVESALAGGLGARVRAEDGVAPHQWLFSESPTRVVVSVKGPDAHQFADLCAVRGVHAQRLGVVTEDDRLEVSDLLAVDLAEARRWRIEGLPAALGEH